MNALQQAQDNAIRQMIMAEPIYPWRIIVRDGEIKQSSSKNDYLSCQFYLGGSDTKTVGDRTIKVISAKKEAKYPVVIFSGGNIESKAIWKVLASCMNEGEFIKLNEHKKDGKDVFDAELNAEYPGRIVTVSVAPHYVRDAKGELLKQTMGANAGQFTVVTELRMFIPETCTDPLTIYQREYSRIKDWVTATDAPAPVIAEE